MFDAQTRQCVFTPKGKLLSAIFQKTSWISFNYNFNLKYWRVKTWKYDLKG